MSKINDYYLMRNERALDDMQEIQQAMTDAQDTWWSPENIDEKYQEHCEKLLSEPPTDIPF